MATIRTTLTSKNIALEIRVAELEAQLAAAQLAAAAAPAKPVRNPDLRDYSLPRYESCNFTRPVVGVFWDLDEAFAYREWLSEQGLGHPVAVRKCSAPNGTTVGAVY